MRWYGQLAVIAVLGGAGYGGWYAWKEGHLHKAPYVAEYAAKYLPPPGAPAPGAPAAGAPGGRGGPQGPATVEVDAVKTGRVVETRDAVGTVRAFESITVTAKVPGIVQEIAFAEGQIVKAGDLLVRLDGDERRSEVEMAVAETRRAVAQRDELNIRLERAAALRRSGAGTEAQVADLTAQVKSLESAIAAAEARRRGAEARMEDMMVRAPFGGRVGTRSVSLGAYVSPGTRITTLDDLSKVRLDFGVPENLLDQLRPGQVVRARSAAFGERLFDGKVAVIDPRIEPTTRSVRLTAEFENKDEALKPGMFLSVAIEVSNKENAVVVPEEAVVSEGLRHVVFLVKDGKVERRVVRIGQRQASRVEITEGLQPGETLIVRGVQRARPGAPVNAKPIGGAPAVAAAPAAGAGRQAGGPQTSAGAPAAGASSAGPPTAGQPAAGPSGSGAPSGAAATGRPQTAQPPVTAAERRS
jgi:membrane fusion protein (multidrug efflux system)